jgi:HAD superfamily hydrolase (TIGR01509 family)
LSLFFKTNSDDRENKLLDRALSGQGDCGNLGNHNSLPSAVIFDMDGVLADTEPLHGACFVEAFGRFGLSVTLEDYRQAVTLGGSTVRDYFARLGGNLSDWETVKAIKDKLLSTAVDGSVQPMPGALDLLRELRSRQVPTALATSARRTSLQIIMDHLDFWDCFSEFVTKDEAQEEKPDPEIFLIAAKKLGVRPEDCVVIEDSPRGLLAADRAGMKCIAVPTPSTADGDFSLAAVVAGSLREVNLELIRSVFRNSEARQ